MADDQRHARDQLAAEAARLQAQRLADAQAELAAQAGAAAARDQHSQAGRSGRLRTALGGGLLVATGIALLGLAAVWLLAASLPVTDDEHEGSEITFEELVVALGLVAGGAALVARHFTSVRRSRRWRSRLPFRVEDFEETVGFDGAVTSAAILVRFRDTAVATTLLTELVQARASGSQVAPLDDAVEIRSPRLGRKDGNRPLARWFRKVVRDVLLDIHRGYPIAAVSLRTLATDEFYVPPAD